MAMAEAVLAMISGLGGAGIGVGGALWAQRVKSRDDRAAADTAARLSRQAEQAAAHRARAQQREELAGEIVATARFGARSWWTSVQRILGDLQAGRSVDARAYDDQLQLEILEFSSAMYRFAATGSYADTPGLRPLVDLLTETGHQIRNAVYISAEGGTPAQTYSELLESARDTYRQMNAYLVWQTEALTERTLPEVHQGIPGGCGSATPSGVDIED